MLKPVLFSQALLGALSEEEAPAMAMEVGPHPALKGPASLTIEEKLGNEVPYTGVLSRGTNDVESISAALGFTWMQLGVNAVNFAGFDSCFNGDAQKAIIKDLPTYTWDHERKFWSESRMSRVGRQREPGSELLGVRSPDDSDGEYTWRNYVKPAEMPWLHGHKIEGQLVYPAAAYISTVIEATKALVPREKTRMIESYDATIHRAITIFDEHAGVEIQVKVINVRTVHDNDGDYVDAWFNYSACMTKDSGNFVLCASGGVKIYLGEPSLSTLPTRPPQPSNAVDCDVDVMYEGLAELGYNYSDMFRGVTELRKSTDTASGVISVPENDGEECPFDIHPAPLDIAFQTILAALGVPGRLFSLHVPMRMERFRLNPFACTTGGCIGTELHFDATSRCFNVTEGRYGDVAVYEQDGVTPILQVEGLHMGPVMPSTADNDRAYLSKTVWEAEQPDVTRDFVEYTPSQTEVTGSALVERIALFHLKALQEAITEEEKEKLEENQKNFLEWAATTVKTVAEGKHAICQKEWLNDTEETIQAQTAACEDYSEELDQAKFVGDRLIPSFRGQLDLLEEIKESSMTTKFYNTAPSFAACASEIGRVIKQIGHRYHHMAMLEVGAGAGSVTSEVLKQIDGRFLTLTYTDASTEALDDAQADFPDQAGRLIHKAMDLEVDPTEQDFNEKAYDLIIASNVCPLTRTLDETLAGLRKLLKPGGYIFLLELTKSESLRAPFLNAASPAWWKAAENQEPFTQMSQMWWDSALKRAGFSGVDSSTPESKHAGVNFSVMLSQAVDNQISMMLSLIHI